MTLVPLDYAVMALSDVTTTELSWADLTAMMSLSPVIGQAFAIQRAIEVAIQREWMLSISRRDALTRLAHLLCELRVRVASAGLANEFGDGLPLTQQVLSDCLGLTPVHLNRVYRQLEKGEIIRRSGRTYEILNLQALTAMGEFEQTYLFLDREGGNVPQKGSGGFALSD
jgi:CRP-like cAMP-binding protein